MNTELSKNEELLSIYRDIQAGDGKALLEYEKRGLDVKKLTTALNYLMANEKLEDKDKASLLKDSWRINFRAAPPSPEEFLTDKYLGRAAGTIYPWVRKVFLDFLNPTSTCRNLILYPHIGFGKSTLSTLITLYITTCVSLMRDPWKYFGKSPMTQFSQLLLSFSLKKSSELLLEPFMNILDESSFFEKVRTVAKMKEKEDEFKETGIVNKIYYTTASPTSALSFSSGLSVKLASSANSLLGLTIISIVMSELGFFREAGKTDDEIMKIYNDAKIRVFGRMQGCYYSATILDSSPNTLNSPIDQYIVRDAEKDPSNMVVKGAIWESNPAEYEEEFRTHNTFKVFLGTNGVPPRILEDDDPLYTSGNLNQSKVIEVPGRYKQYFVDDIVKSIKDYAGIPSGSEDSLISNYNIIDRMFLPNLRSLYSCIQAPADVSPNHLIWDQIQSTFFINKAGRFEFYYKPWTPRFISVDQSFSTDVTGIAMVHSERLKETSDPIYVVDFVIPITPEGGKKINLDAIRMFIEDLRNIGNINVAGVSYDQFQSETAIQSLKRADFEVSKVSVDLSMGPYLNLMHLLNTNRLVAGRNLFLRNNLKSLVLTKTKTGKKPKIDHDSSRAPIISGDLTWETSKIGYFAKDTSDAVAAAIELCSTKYEPTDIWTGGPDVDDKSAEVTRAKAEEKISKFLKSWGLSKLK